MAEPATRETQPGGAGAAAPWNARAAARLRPLAAAAWRLLRPALPHAVLLATLLGGVLALGVNLSNAWPSESRPFGWPGPSRLDYGVASVRPELLVAGSLVPLLWGVRSGGALAPAGGVAGLARRAGTDLAVAAAAVAAGCAAGWWASRGTPEGVYADLAVAHVALAAAFLSVGILLGAAGGRLALPAAAGAWTVLAVAWEPFVRWRLFREAGYHELAAGDFPAWFFAAQILSPASGYRALLILSQDGFRDAVENAALGDAAMPAWLTAANVALAMAVLWVLLPLALAAAALRVRRAARGRPAPGPGPLPGGPLPYATDRDEA